MQIFNNKISPSFNGMLINYGAQENLERLPKHVLCKIHRLGQYMESTDFTDVYIKNDLTPVIREKGKRFSELLPPFVFFKPQEGAREMKVRVKSTGEPLMGKKLDGDTEELNLTFKNPDNANAIYERLCIAKGDIEKSVLLAKLIDTERKYNLKLQTEYNHLEDFPKSRIIDDLFYKFGDF